MHTSDDNHRQRTDHRLTHRFRAFLRVRFATLATLVVVPHVAAAAELMAFRNSPALTEVTGLNDRGLILGRREILGQAGELSSMPFVRRDGADQSVPIASQFTNAEPMVVTASGHVVGFMTRPAGHPDGNLRAFLWQADRPDVDLLPLPDGMRDSCAFDGSHDAQVISGYAIGRDPPRLQPCVWQLGPSGWECTLLSVIEPYNPLLVSAHVVLSDDGQIVAASLVTGRMPDGTLRYGLFRWMRNPEGQWERESVNDRAVHLGDVNDEGMIVGRVLQLGKQHPFIYHPAAGAQVLDLPAGRGGGRALDVNRHGQVVGVWEDPPGPEGTMSAFLWDRGEWTDLPFGVDVAASTANVITDEGRIGGLLVRVPPDHTEADGPDQAAEEAEAAVESYVLLLDPLSP